MQLMTNNQLFFTNTNVTNDDTDAEMGFKNDAILKQINFITGTQYDPSALTSITDGTQDDPSTLPLRMVDSNKSSNLTPDKGHKKNSVTISPLQKYLIHQIEISETRGPKPHYTGSDNLMVDYLTYVRMTTVTSRERLCELGGVKSLLKPCVLLDTQLRPGLDPRVVSILE